MTSWKLKDLWQGVFSDLHEVSTLLALANVMTLIVVSTSMANLNLLNSNPTLQFVNAFVETQWSNNAIVN